MASADRRSASGVVPGGPDFWLELYWFLVICLVGWITAMAVLPPAMVRLREALAYEAACRSRVEGLTVRHTELKKVVPALETDPYYRREVIRAVLGVKERHEEFLTTAVPAGDP